MMSYDERLNIILPEVQIYNKGMENKVKELEIKYKNQELEEIVAWLVEILLSQVKDLHIESHIKPLTIPEELKDSIEKVEHVLKNHDSIINDGEPESVLLCKEIGKKIAEVTGVRFQCWDEVNKLIHEQFIIHNEWIKNLPLETISNNQEEIFKIPSYNHPLELVETWGILHEKIYWDSFDENCKSNESKARDIWDYIDLSINYHNEFTLGTELKLRSLLTRKLGLELWLVWIIKLPLIQIKEAAISELNSLDEIEEAVKILLKLKDQDENEIELIISLIIFHNIDLFMRINNNLEHYSSESRAFVENDDEFRKKCSIKFKSWKNNELPERLNRLVDALVSNNKCGRNTAINMMRHLAAKNEKDTIVPIIRETLIKTFAKHMIPLKELVNLIMDNNINTKSLLNCLLLFLNFQDINEEDIIEMSNKFWSQYLNLLEEGFYWDETLNENKDSTQLLWTLAGVISNLPNPKKVLIESLDIICLPSEGWLYDGEKYYQSIRKVCHCLIIGSMAAEWIAIGKKDKKLAQQLYSYVWDYTHNWLRQITNHYPEEIETLLIQLWARLSLIYEDNFEEKIIQTIKYMDNLRHIIVALKILLANLKVKNPQYKYSDTIKALIKDKHDLSFQIERLKYNVNEKMIKWYLESIDALVN